ncbi:hypothetical protein ACEPAF_1182 [Sanghuangporus sanghuang]
MQNAQTTEQTVVQQDDSGTYRLSQSVSPPVTYKIAKGKRLSYPSCLTSRERPHYWNMFYSAGNASASSGRTERASKRRGGHHNRNSAQGATGNESVLPGRSKAHTPNAPSERVELSHTSAGRIPDKRKEEELLNETKSIADELYMEYIVPLTKYHCFVRLRAEVIGCLKAQQDAESSSRYVEEVKESVKAAQREAKGGKSTGMGTTEAGQVGATFEDLKKAQHHKTEADLAQNAAFKSLHKAHLEVVKHNENGFGAGGKSQDKADLAIEEFSRTVFLAVTKSPIFYSIEVLSILNHAVGALDKLRDTYSRKDILRLKSEIEHLIKKHRQLQRQEQSNKQGIRDLEQHHLEVEKLHETAKKIRDQELKDSSKRIERYNLKDVLDSQMADLKVLEKSLPEDKIE